MKKKLTRKKSRLFDDIRESLREANDDFAGKPTKTIVHYVVRGQITPSLPGLTRQSIPFKKTSSRPLPRTMDVRVKPAHDERSASRKSTKVARRPDLRAKPPQTQTSEIAPCRMPDVQAAQGKRMLPGAQEDAVRRPPPF